MVKQEAHIEHFRIQEILQSWATVLFLSKGWLLQNPYEVRIFLAIALLADVGAEEVLNTMP